MKHTKEMHATLRSEAARALVHSRRFRDRKDCEIWNWFDGRYRGFKQSADLLALAIKYDDLRDA